MQTSPVLIFLVAALAGGRAAGDGMPESLVRDDPRLSQVVTVTAPEITLYDLVRRLSVQTGIQVSVEDPGEVDGTLLAVAARDVPVREILDGIWSMFSYKRAEWNWDRTGQPGAYRYALTRSGAARRFGATVRGWTVASFTAECEAMIEFAKLSSEERASRAPQILSTLFEQDGSRMQRILESKRMWDGIRLFGATTSGETRTTILRGDAGPQVQLSSLPAETRALALNMTIKSMMRNESARANAPDPDYLQFTAFRERQMGAPTLTITFGYANKRDRFPVFPGESLDGELMRWLRAQWGRPGDQDLRGASASVPPRPPVAGAVREIGSPLAMRVMQIARDAGVAIIARLPLASNADPGEYKAQPIDDYAAGLAKVGLMHKWRSGMLLLSSGSWADEEEYLVGQRTIQWIYAAAARGNGYLSVADLASLSARLTREQLSGLGRRFRVCNNLAQWRGILGLAGRSPTLLARLRAPGGAPVTDELSPLLRGNPGTEFDQVLQDGRAATVRIEELGAAAARELAFRLLDKDGHDLSAIGFGIPVIHPEKEDAKAETTP